MVVNYYMPTGEAKKMEWLDNFSSKLPNYATKYAIDGATVTQLQQDATVFRFFIDLSNKLSESSKKITQYKREIANGSNSALDVPTALPDINPPFLPVAGVFKRAATIASSIKTNELYLISDGKDLGLEISALTAQNKVILKPLLTVQINNGGQPMLVWKKAYSDALEIHVDRGTGSFQLLNISLKNMYLDTATLPNNGTAQVWKYKAIYRAKDTTVGLWSDVVEISVK